MGDAEVATTGVSEPGVGVMATETAIPSATRDPLDRVRGLIRRYVVIEGLLAAGFVFALAVCVSLAVDFGLFYLAGVDLVLDAPGGLRLAGLVVTVALAAGVLLLLVAVRLARRFSDPEIALLLERRFPEELGDRLITAIELADEAKATRHGYSLALVRRTTAEAAERVAGLPVSRVFDWARLRRRAALLAVVVLVPLLAFGAAAALGVTHVTDRATIWAERNALLWNTPWPRDAYLHVVKPSAEEYRVARDAVAPSVRVRAAGWVVADSSERFGWRPLTWGDLSRLGVESTPAAFPAGVSVDDVLETDAGRPEVAAVVGRLDARAADPGQWRTLRKLEAPESVALRYTGLDDAAGNAGSTRGELTLAREPGGDYTGELVGLKESVSYTARARDFRTDPRQVVLVPPPLLTRLARRELQPAYLYHLPPIDEPGALAGLKQVQPERELSITGERSTCTVPVGTELDLVGVADKPLARVEVKTKRGRVPGAVVEGDGFTMHFFGPETLTADAEFELTLVDADGVTSRRPVLIQAVEDRAPVVEVAGEGLRKLGGGFIGTARALVPLVKESLVRDDAGIASAEFQFTARKLESVAAVNLMAQVGAGSVAVTPVLGGVGVHPLFAALVAKQLGGGALTQSASLPLPPFERAASNRRRLTAQALRDVVTKPLPADWPPILKDLRFGLEGDSFDLDLADAVLERGGRRMRVASSADIQPRYRVDVAVVATDSNATNPKTSRGLEPIRLTVVPEADLLAEVTKDEEAQTAKFDEALRRVREAQAKLAPLADRVTGGVVPADVLSAGRVRAEDIAQDAAKCRDLLANVVSEYGRLTREVRLNRCDPAVARRFETAVISPIEAVLAAEMKRAEEALAAFRDGFTQAAPEPRLGAEARSALAALLARMELIRRGLGDSLSEAKLRDDLKRIIDRQREVTLALEGLRKQNTESLFAPELAQVPPVMLKSDGKVTVKVPINWNLFDKDALGVHFNGPPGGEVAVPADLKLSSIETELSFELTAKGKPGSYTVQVVPAVGKPLAVSVTVK